MQWLVGLLRALSFFRLVWPKLLQFIEQVQKKHREARLRKAFRNAKKTGDTSDIERFLQSGGLSDKPKDKPERKG